MNNQDITVSKLPQFTRNTPIENWMDQLVDDQEHRTDFLEHVQMYNARK